VKKIPAVNVNGINLYYRLHGQGEPLVLIMGLGGGHGAWFFQIRAFRKHYRLITFDNRGVGRTDRPGESYATRTMADDTVGLMDSLGIEKAHILGVSLGGMIAQEVAVNYPQRVKKLILVSTTAGMDETRDVPSELLKAAGIDESSAVDDIRSVDINKLMSSLNSLAFNRRIYKMFVLPLTYLYMRRVGIDGLLGQFEAAMGHNTLDRLHLIEAPTLVMTGSADRLIPPDSSDVIASRIPSARLVKVEGGSHTFLAEMRNRFNKEVLDFLRYD
jgi:pimeloyl-ACP methyl ester carboxylesterase